jgi:hypothetical protein
MVVVKMEHTDKFEVIGNVKAGFKTTGGTASQFLKANGTVDSNVYLTGVIKQWLV